jgi:hypothetical protein
MSILQPPSSASRDNIFSFSILTPTLPSMWSIALWSRLISESLKTFVQGAIFIIVHPLFEKFGQERF